MTAKTIVSQLQKCFKNGGTCYLMGNGGSAQMANHFAAELIHEKLPAISLTTDMSVITATANDFSFKEIFARQIIALGSPGDVLIGISTSGKSQNILYAYQWAKRLGLEVIDFPRKGKNTQDIQEKQLHLIHQVWRYLK